MVRVTMRGAMLAAVLGLVSACAPAVSPAPPTAAPTAAGGRPALVVLVVVDQLRPDLLVRYDSLFTGGFRRLLDQGHQFVNATHDHSNTKTAPGHASLSTGVYPSRHGIVSNEWWEKVGADWVSVENVFDSTTRVAGDPRYAAMSPHNLLRAGLADWIVAADSGSQVATVSGKDRGAILLAGKTRGQVYWFDQNLGRFVTSTYYREKNPAWVDRFNRSRLARYRGDSVWNSRIPAAALALSPSDTAAYEADGVHTAFPHRFGAEANPNSPNPFWAWFQGTPMLDEATLDFAETMVGVLSLGRDGAPDLLGVSLSQTDRVGHSFGPLSREQLDNLLRLDRRLGEFFAFLDRSVGSGRWVIALSADHGVLTPPEQLREMGGWGHRVTDADRQALLQAYGRAGGEVATPERLAAEVKRLDFVANAYTHAELTGSAPPSDSFAVLFRRSYYPGRALEEPSRYGIEIRYVPGLIDRRSGTTHGAPYQYDRQIPMIFSGPGIAPARDSARAGSVDLAPTLARLLGITVPNDLDGRPLSLAP